MNVYYGSSIKGPFFSFADSSLEYLQQWALNRTVSLWLGGCDEIRTNGHTLHVTVPTGRFIQMTLLHFQVQVHILMGSCRVKHISEEKLTNYPLFQHKCILICSNHECSWNLLCSYQVKNKLHLDYVKFFKEFSSLNVRLILTSRFARFNYWNREYAEF